MSDFKFKLIIGLLILGVPALAFLIVFLVGWSLGFPRDGLIAGCMIAIFYLFRVLGVISDD